jgi:hypothetical protein
MTTTAASASSVSGLTVGVHPPTPGAAASYAISYTPAANQKVGNTISVVAAPGTTFSACSGSCSSYTVAQGGSYKTYSKVAVYAVDGSSTTNEFVITQGWNVIYGGTSVTILAEGTNPATAGIKTLSVSTSVNVSPVSVNYAIGATSAGLLQGAVPNAASDPQFDLSSPTYLQSLFGTPTATNPNVGLAYIPSSNWTQMDGATGSLTYLRKDGWSTPNNQPTPGYQLVLGVPMLPSKGSPTLADGANGDYNAYFHQMAKSLIAEGLGNSWLRLGYEFDNTGTTGPTTPWGTGHSTVQEGYFAQFFQQIVTSMRGVQGAAFKFVWNPDGFAFLGSNDPEYPTGYDLAAAWPGAHYVDYIGSDLYDLEPSSMSGYSQAQNWTNFVEPQLQAAQQFAAAQGVPLTFPEWGVMAPEPTFAGMGDDPSYVNGMYCFMTNPANNVAWETYSNTSYNGWNSEITGGTFPASLAAYQADFGQGSTAACS